MKISVPPSVTEASVIIGAFYSDGFDLLVDYVIQGTIAAFNIAVYASPDGEEREQRLEVKPAELGVGAHTLRIAPTFADLLKDYYLVAKVDSDDAVTEVNEANNQAPYNGGAFLSNEQSSGKLVIHVHGGDKSDDLSTQARSSTSFRVKLSQRLAAPSAGNSPPPYYDFDGDGQLTDTDIAGVQLGLAGALSYWHNTSYALDVNNDGFVSPVDALLVVDYLNDLENSVLARPPNLPFDPSGGGVPEMARFIDASGDNILSTLDAYLVIAALNNEPPPTPVWRNNGMPLDIDLSSFPSSADLTVLQAAAPRGSVASYEYDLNAIDEIHARLHDGNDVATIRSYNGETSNYKQPPAWLFGGAGGDELHGGAQETSGPVNPDAADLIFGGAGDDELYGHDGDDELYGEAGDDCLWGGTGEDLFDGGTGINCYHDEEITADGDTVVTEQDVPVAITLVAEDADDDPLTYSIVATPQNGVLLGDAPNLVYQPNAGFIGTEAFSFQASDGSYYSNVAVVNVEVNYPLPQNHAPVAVDDYYELDDDDQVTLYASSLISNDTDADNDTISFVAITSQPTRGQLQDVGNGQWLYIPNTGVYGTDYLEYKITDDKDYATGRVYLTVFRKEFIWGDLFAWQYFGPDLVSKEVPEQLEEDPGIGIRRNGDDDNGNFVADRGEDPVTNENDLLYAGVRFNEDISIIQAAGYELQLRRSNDAIQLWDGSTKTVPHFAAGVNSVTYIPAPPGERSDNFFIEWSSSDATVTSSNLEVWIVGNGVEYETDRLILRPFKSLVIGFVGESQNAGDQAVGINQVIGKLRNEGYDAVIYDEDDITYDSPFSYVKRNGDDAILAHGYTAGQGQAQQKSIAEAINAIRKQGVTELAIIGYSHGGGAVHELATALQNEFGVGYTDFDLKYTAYIDAVTKQSVLAETRRPPETEYHVNLWQSGPPVAAQLRLVQGASVPGADLNDNVDTNSDGGLDFVPQRLHTNRKTIPTGERRGIMETEPLQASILNGTMTIEGMPVSDGFTERVKRF